MFNTLVKFVVLACLIISCSAKVEKKDGKVTASFYIDSIDGVSEVSKIDSTFGLPTQRLYNFKVCVKDIMQSKAIAGQVFDIRNEKLSKTLRSDEAGCLNWAEEVDYNFMAQSKYIETSRIIEARDVHRGEVLAKMIINPWSHGEDATRVINPDKKTINSNALINEKFGSSALVAKESRSPLWVQNPRVSILEEELTGAGAKMVLKLQSKLSLQLKGSNEQLLQYNLSQGKFKVDVQLYNLIADNKVNIFTGAQDNVTFTQDSLLVEFPFELNQLPIKGQIYLALKISPVASEVSLDSFESVYLISDSAKIKFDGVPTIAKNIRFNDVATTIESSIGNSVQSKPGVEVEKLDVKFFKIGAENTTDRQVFFNVRACLKSNLDGRTVRDESVLVKGISQKEEMILKTNQDGCVSWDDSIWHKFFAAERFLKKTIVITHQGFNLNKKIEILINPWDFGSNFARDSRFVEDMGSLAINPSGENSKITFDNYSFSINGYGYEINKSLDLAIVKKGILALSAKVVNHSSLSEGRMSNQSLRDGQYLLKWAVVSVDQNEKAEALISNGQTAVNVYGGDLKTELAIKIQAFEKLNVRSKLVFALYTVKEGKNKNGTLEIDRSSGLEATAHEASIVLNNDQESQKALRIDNNLGLGKGDLFEKLSNLPSASSNSTLSTQKALAAQNLKLINLNIEKESLYIRDGLANPNKFNLVTNSPAYYHEADQKPALALSSLVEIAKSGKISANLARSMCQFWFNDYFRRLKKDSTSGVLGNGMNNQLAQACSSNFFVVEKKLLINKIGDVKYLGGSSSNLSVGSSFNISNSQSETKTQSWSWSATAGLSYDLFDIIKLGTNVNYSLSKAKATSNATSTSGQVNASTYLTVQNSTFNLEIQSYEECSAIRLNPSLFMGANARYKNIWNQSMKASEIAKVATGGFFFCTGVANNNSFVKKENYYLVMKDISSAKGEQDMYAQENQQFFMTFRGQQDLSRLIDFIQGQVKTNSNNSAEKNLSSQSFSGANFQLLPTWPGVVNP
jgi:hypothetical protein